MMAIGVTYREGSYNRSTESHDWKRRGERLVRSSGCEYTIVRPVWFDYNKGNEHHLEFLQGDTRKAGNSSDGVIARQQLAEVLVGSLTSPPQLIRRSSWLQRRVPLKGIWSLCLPLWKPTHKMPSMVSLMRRISRSNTSRSACGTIFSVSKRDVAEATDDEVLLATLLTASCLPSSQAQQVGLQTLVLA